VRALRRVNQLLVPIVTVALLGAMHAGLGADAGDEAVDRYHAGARAAIGQVPERIGSWVGSDVEVPQSALVLLKPNALLGRRYFNESSGRAVTLVIVQCRDTRDMSGHYPPVCYPAHGWTSSSEPEEVELAVGSERLRVTRYRYMRTEFDHTTRITIFGMFVMPGTGIVQDMPGVRRAASDYRLRRFGAAQVQVVMDGTLAESEQVEIAGEILGAVRSVFGELAGVAGGEAL